MTVLLRFLPDNIVAMAQPGEPLLEVARRSGVTIPTGCMMGSCHACEVDINGEPHCSCITAVPDSTDEVVVDLYGDPVW